MYECSIISPRFFLDEAHLRKSPGDQFDLAVETTVGEIMDKDEQQLQRKKQPVVEQVIKDAEEADSSSVDEEIDTTILEEQGNLLAYFCTGI